MAYKLPKMPNAGLGFAKLPDILNPFVKVRYIREMIEWLAGYRPPVPVADGPVEIDFKTEYAIYSRIAMDVQRPSQAFILSNVGNMA